MPLGRLSVLVCYLVAVALVTVTPALLSQTYDFEDGLDGWTGEGNAYLTQPVRADRILTQDILGMSLGGDYWRGLQYPLGQHGSYLVMTKALLGDAATGSVVSPIFTLDAAKPYASFRIGGTHDLAHERLELQVRVTAAEVQRVRDQVKQWAKDLDPSPIPSNALMRDGEYLIVIAQTGDSETLQQRYIELPPFLFEREARWKIIDASDKGHINVDYLQFSASAPQSIQPPVWGYADYHTHPTDHLAFGGLRGVFPVWGDPGGSIEEYAKNPNKVYDDLTECNGAHNGGPLATPFLNGAQKLSFAVSPTLLIPHGGHGAKSFEDWPAFTAGAHQQLHITQIYRDWQGGLRLIVGLATDNWGAEYLTGHVENHGVPLVKEQDSVVAQINAMKSLAAKNSNWMEVAYSPQDARRIILQGKLALIMGVEVDQLGTYGYSTPQQEVEYLWNLGVRVMTPVHAADNLIGGAAVFIGPYNWLNDLLYRTPRDMNRDQVRSTAPQFSPQFFKIVEDKCALPFSEKIGECVELRLDPNQSRVYVGRCLASLFRESPCLEPRVDMDYDTALGQKNQIGLKVPFGTDYLMAMMDRGMILDTAHMSQASVEDTFDLIGRRLAREHPECSGFAYRTEVSDVCNALAYPAIVSHAHFRAQAIYGSDDFPPSEYDISNRSVEMVRRVGGVLGPFVTEDRIAPGGDDNPPYEHNCAMSSKSFGYSFHFALQRMGGSGVGMATDATFIPMLSPRFGDDACWAYHLARDPDEERKLHKKDRYAVQDQRDGVYYKYLATNNRVRLGANLPLEPYVLGKYRTYDFNVDGLAHIGLIPDMLQDLKNVGLSRSDFQALFSSAEGYIEMWEKAERVSGAHFDSSPPVK